MPKESAIVGAIVRAAKADGWWTMKIHGGPYQISGVPDLLCIRNGEAVFLEVKQPGKKPTQIQVARMLEIEKVGKAKCFVTTSKEDAIEKLRTHQKVQHRDALDHSVDRCERRCL